MDEHKNKYAQEKLIGDEEYKNMGNISGKGKTKKTSIKLSSKISLTVLIVFTILEMAALVTLVVKWRIDRKAALAPREQTVCLQCKELGIISEELPEELKGKISRKQQENSKEWDCCGHTSSILDWMVAKAISEQDTGLSLFPLVSKECKITTTILPSAQLNGISLSEIGNDGKSDVLHWKTTDTSFLKGGISYKDGKLKIKESGYYYIFSQITFKNIQQNTSRSTVAKEETRSSLDHYMYHNSVKDGGTKMILEASKSPCEIPSLNDATTSTVGAVFYLEENDMIFVNTSHPKNLVSDREENHFGLYLT